MNVFYPELLSLIEGSNDQKEISISCDDDDHDSYSLFLTKREGEIHTYDDDDHDSYSLFLTKREGEMHTYDYVFQEDGDSYHQSCTGHFILEGLFITESSVFDKYEEGFLPEIDQIMNTFFTPEIPTLFQKTFFLCRHIL